MGIWKDYEAQKESYERMIEDIMEQEGFIRFCDCRECYEQLESDIHLLYGRTTIVAKKMLGVEKLEGPFREAIYSVLDGACISISDCATCGKYAE